MEKETNNKLQLIPKIERYVEYIFIVLNKLPRTEKFSIGTEYKQSMYKMLRDTMYITKLESKNKCLELVNTIDAELNTQRIYLRIMQKEKWIDTKKFNVAMGLIYEIGKIIGGLVKYYAKNGTRSI